MRAIRLACAALLLPLFAYAQPAPAQEPASAAEPTFRTGIRLVRVDVTVSSRKGEPITGLTADDFEVLEDEVPQKIESLQFVRLSGSPPPDDDLSLTIRSPEHAAQEAARDDVRVLVIFVDDYHLRYGPLHDHQLKQVLRRFVMAEMKPLDLFAVMGPLTPISDLGLTRNRQEILDRIDRLEGRLGGFVPPRSALEENQFSLNPAARARVRAQISLAALQSLAVHLGGLREGRKSVLFVSQGPPIIVDRLGLFNQVRDVVTSANTSNVTIHTMDPRELGASTGLSATNEIFSAETGGRRLAQSNDHTRGLQAVMMDASAYYLIGYAPGRELEVSPDPGESAQERGARARPKGILGPGGSGDGAAEDNTSACRRHPRPDVSRARGTPAAGPGFSHRRSHGRGHEPGHDCLHPFDAG